MQQIIDGKADEPQNQKIEEENVELDMNKFGDCEVQTSGGKPVFEKITKVLVKSAVWMTTKERKEDKTKDGKPLVYYPAFLKVVYEIDEKEIYENYGGGKLFVSEKTDENKFWIGKDSALGKLKQVIEESKDFNGTVKEIANEIMGEQAGIITEYVTVSGKKYTKNMIKQFY